LKTVEAWRTGPDLTGGGADDGGERGGVSDGGWDGRVMAGWLGGSSGDVEYEVVDVDAGMIGEIEAAERVGGG